MTALADDPDAGPGLTEDLREELAAGIARARAVAVRAGALHALWDPILDAEALLDGQPTLLSGTPRAVALALLAQFGSVPLPPC